MPAFGGPETGGHRTSVSVSRHPSAKETLRIVLARLDDMKAEDSVTIDLAGRSSIADFIVVASGRSVAMSRPSPKT
jgi:ribosome-associated protein